MKGSSKTFRGAIGAFAALVCVLPLGGTMHGTASPIDPPAFSCLVLDPTGDGISMVDKASGVRFDLDGDGKSEQVGWTSKNADDSFLALDVNRNGLIDNGTELVGSRLSMSDGSQPGTGLKALILLQDGVKIGPDGRAISLPPDAGRIASDDAIYARLRIWTDSNHDGVSQSGELKSLAEAQVSYLRTGMRGQKDLKSGNEIFMVGSFMVSRRGVDFPRPMVEVRLAQ